MAATDRSSQRRDRAVVALQVGRRPRGEWCTRVECGFGFPQVIETAPRLEDGSPFPTLYWLTCPFLVRAVGALESSGAVGEWASRLAGDDALAERQLAADTGYRAARAARAGEADPCSGVGIAGQRDPLATKCLHAHVATFLAGIDDPAGEWVLGMVARECPDAECERLVPGEREAGS